MLDFFKKLFSLLNVRYTTDWLSRQIDDMPYANSVLGISAILWKYGINNKAVRLTIKNDIRSINLPCIVLYKQRFVIVQSIRDDSVQIVCAGKSTEWISFDVFFNDWDGVIILVNANSKSQEPKYRDHLKQSIYGKIKKTIIWGSIGLLCSWGIYHSPANHEWFWWIILLVNCIGIGITYLLLQKDMHIPNILADKICGLVKHSNCNSVTQTKVASLWGFIKLSEIGASFFSVNLITLLFFNKVLPVLALVSILVLPFSFWSVWYQRFKIKQWCVLCLITLVLMWAQAIVFMVSTGIGDPTSQEFIINVVKIAIGYVFVALLIDKWVKIKELLQSDKFCRNRYNNLKFQEDVVSAIEGNANYFDTDIDSCTSLIFGQHDAPYCLTVFSNPFCNPCASLHRQIKDYINRNVSIKYVFTYFSEDLSNINKLFIASYQQLGPDRTWELMTQWYDGGQKKGLQFFDGLGLNIETKEVIAEFSKHNNWRNDDRLHGTPTVMINGREIVFPYDVNDYMFL